MPKGTAKSKSAANRAKHTRKQNKKSEARIRKWRRKGYDLTSKTKLWRLEQNANNSRLK